LLSLAWFHARSKVDVDVCLPAGAYPKFHLELTSRKSA
jgi:hypothetical protein